MEAEATSALLNEKGIATDAIRLTEDNFRYRYVDLSSDITDALRENGLYDSDEHSYDDEEDFTGIEGWLVTEKDMKRVRALRIWKTPCGHSRLWFLEAEDVFREGTVILLSVRKGSLIFCDSELESSIYTEKALA